MIILSVSALILVLAGPVAWVQFSQRSRIRSVEAAESSDVALVLGAGLRTDGSPSLYLERRLDIASQLFDAGKVRAILVSGDNSTVYHDEPTAMRDWLVDHGVPTSAIVLDHAGLDTHDSCVRAYEVFGVRHAIVITQDYHLPRALFSCAHAGIEVTGTGASSEGGTVSQYRLRELPASWKAAWDAVTHREPTYLGPQETDLDDLLSGS